MKALKKLLSLLRRHKKVKIQVPVSMYVQQG